MVQPRPECGRPTNPNGEQSPAITTGLPHPSTRLQVGVGAWTALTARGETSGRLGPSRSSVPAPPVRGLTLSTGNHDTINPRGYCQAINPAWYRLVETASPDGASLRGTDAAKHRRISG